MVIINDGTKFETMDDKKQELFTEVGNELVDLGLGISKGKYCEGCVDLTIKGLISKIIKLKKLKTLQEDS